MLAASATILWHLPRSATIPEANTGMSAAALGNTFPFNLAVGIPLYSAWVQFLTR